MKDQDREDQRRRETARRGGLLVLFGTAWAILILWFVFGCASVPTRRVTAPAILTVHTSSMEPFFHVGQVVLVSPCDFYAVPLGSPVLVWWEGRQLNILHKLIARRSDGSMITRGIANLDRDRFVTSVDDFVGCVEKVP